MFHFVSIVVIARLSLVTLWLYHRSNVTGNYFLIPVYSFFNSTTRAFINPKYGGQYILYRLLQNGAVVTGTIGGTCTIDGTSVPMGGYIDVMVED